MGAGSSSAKRGYGDDGKTTTPRVDYETAKLLILQQQKELVELRAREHGSMLHWSAMHGLNPTPAKANALVVQDARSHQLQLTSSTRTRKALVNVSCKKGSAFDSIELRKVPKIEYARDIIWSACLDNLLFASLTKRDRTALTDPFEPRDIEKGHVLISQGEDGDEFFVVESGRLLVYVRPEPQPPSGASECRTIHTSFDKERYTSSNDGTDYGKRVLEYGPGSSFGELALLYGAPRAATVVAVEASRVWQVKRAACRGALYNIQTATIKRHIAFLRKVKVGSDELGELLLDDELSELAACLEEEHVPAGTVIIQQGDPGNHFYIVEEGAVSVNRVEASSGRNLALCVKQLGVGSYFGERALINEEVRAASVVAESEVHLLTLARHDFNKHLGSLSEVLAAAHAQGGTAQARHKLAHASKRMSQLRLGEDSMTSRRPPMPPAIELEDLEVLRVLGKGAYGTVHLVRHHKTRAVFASKAQSKQMIIDRKMEENVILECKILAFCESPFLLKLHCGLQNSKYIYLLIEYLPGGELYDHLQEAVCFSEHAVRFYVSQVILAFQCIHDSNVVYRDLKPENVVLDARGYVKVVDFGLSKHLVDWKTWTWCGTPDYLAPEIVRNEGHNKAVDFWTIGILLYELAHGSGPFTDNDDMVLYQNILNGRVSFPRSFSKHLKDLISKLLKPQKDRLGAGKDQWLTVTKHAWFTGFDWNAIALRELAAPIKPRSVAPVNDAASKGSLASFEEAEAYDSDWYPKLPLPIAQGTGVGAQKVNRLLSTRVSMIAHTTGSSDAASP